MKTNIQDVKVKIIYNFYGYYKGAMAGSVFGPVGISPALRSGQGLRGRGIGSCNAPKIIIYEDE